MIIRNLKNPLTVALPEECMECKSHCEEFARLVEKVERLEEEIANEGRGKCWWVLPPKEAT